LGLRSQVPFLGVDSVSRYPRLASGKAVPCYPSIMREGRHGSALCEAKMSRGAHVVLIFPLRCPGGLFVGPIVDVTAHFFPTHFFSAQCQLTIPSFSPRDERGGGQRDQGGPGLRAPRAAPVQAPPLSHRNHNAGHVCTRCFRLAFGGVGGCDLANPSRALCSIVVSYNGGVGCGHGTHGRVSPTNPVPDRGAHSQHP